MSNPFTCPSDSVSPLSSGLLSSGVFSSFYASADSPEKPSVSAVPVKTSAEFNLDLSTEPQPVKRDIKISKEAINELNFFI